MKFSLIIRPEAEADLADAYDWYERQREGLGAEFLSSVNDGMKLIRGNPRLFPVIRKEAHRALIHRFPYGILFVIHGEIVSVVGVFHASRDPKSWDERL